MTAEVPVAREEDTIGAIRLSLGRVQGFETINYIYVLDGEEKLVGIASIKDIFRRPEHAKVGEICKRTSLVTIHPEADQEHAAYLALKHNIKALPVVDSTRRFLGVLPSDTILAILHKEMREDILHRAGLHHHGTHHEYSLESAEKIPVFPSFLHRLPWLAVGLLGGLAVANVVDAFEATLEKNLILAAFIPLIVYMGDAVGTQMEALIIRDLAIANHVHFWRYFTRQLAVISLMAGIFGGTFIAVGPLFLHSARVALVIGVSLALAILSSVCTGLITPYILSRLRTDPANASGPTATIIQDFLSVLIYFSVASLLL